MNVLLVEDEAGIRESLAAYLRIKGHRVLTASSCEQGLALLRDEQLDLLITDWRIGEGLGAALVVASACPAIVVSGDPAEVAGVGPQVTVLRKPVLPGELLRTVEAFGEASRSPSATAGSDAGAGAGANAGTGAGARAGTGAETPPAAALHDRDEAAASLPAVDRETRADTAALLGELPCDTRDRVVLALALAGAPAASSITDDGTCVVVAAELARGEAAIAELEQLGGDLCVRRSPAGLRFELRIWRDDRPEDLELVLGPDDTWPRRGVRFAIDWDRAPAERLPEFLAALARVRRRPRGSVAFLNVPSAWRLWIEITGKGGGMPKRQRAGPRLPEFLSLLWS